MRIPRVALGQAKKGVTTQEWRSGDRIGDVVRRDDLIYLDDYRRYELPLLPNGQRYAVVNDRIVVISSENYAILQLIRAFTDNCAASLGAKRPRQMIRGLSKVERSGYARRESLRPRHKAKVT